MSTSNHTTEHGGGSEPNRQKLRSSDPDLKIVVKSGGGGGGEDKEKFYLKCSTMMAYHSGFVDATLSNPMRENETKTIIFHDVSPEVFELALEYLENPTKARQATASDVLQVVEFYDKYEFRGGIELADGILVDFFKEQNQLPGKLPKSLDFYVHAVHSAHRFNLKKSTEEGIKGLDFGDGESTDTTTGIHPRMLQEKHVSMLQPLFMDKILALPTSVSLESSKEIVSTLFPKYFVRCVRDHLPTLKSFMLKFSMNDVGNKLVKESSPNMRMGWVADDDGEISGLSFLLVRKLPATSEGDNVNDLSDPLWVEGLATEGGDWAIICGKDGEFEINCVFVAPYSAHLGIPPREPWIPVFDMDSSTESKTNELRVMAARLGKPVLYSFEY